MRLKICSLCFLANLILCLCGCESKHQDVGGDVSFDTLKVDSVVIDTVLLSNNSYIRENYANNPPYLKCIAEYPIYEQNPTLADSFAVWVNYEYCRQNYGELYPREIPTLNKEYFLNNADADAQFTISIRKVYENAHIITFISETDYYGYGAHGIQSTHGATFIKETGKLLGWNMFKSDADIQTLLKQGLEHYFKTDNLRGKIGMFVNDLNSIPLPYTCPWIEKDGIRFLYGNYEIASYADGLPTFVIPIKETKSILTSETYILLK